MSVSGWLDKKSGGKEGSSKAWVSQKWDKRWFALEGTVLSYYKSQEDQKKGKTPLGFIDALGAEVFLKEVKGVTFRFTVKNATRELKLRASTPSDYHTWSNALQPLAGHVGELRERGETFVTGDEDEGPPKPRPSRPPRPSIAAPLEASQVGWLEKKSGSKKEGAGMSKVFEKWDKRWFALIGSELHYFKSEEEQRTRKPSLGSLECQVRADGRWRMATT